MKIEVRTKDPVDILDVVGSLDIGKGEVRLRETFRQLLDAGRRRFIFNLDDTTFVDSSGLAEIVACQKRALERHATIKIVVPRKSKARDVFVTTMFDRVFELYTDEEEAIASFIGEMALS